MDLSQVKAKVFMPLSKGQVAKVDFVDWYEKLLSVSWHCKDDKGLYYAVCTKHHYVNGLRKSTHPKMHRIIMGVTDRSVKVDHIDGNGLNNCKNNLRLCTQQENTRNRKKINSISGYKGVYPSGRMKAPWMARVHLDYRAINLGNFPCKHEAAEAYNAKAKELFGEFASLNCISR